MGEMIPDEAIVVSDHHLTNPAGVPLFVYEKLLRSPKLYIYVMLPHMSEHLWVKISCACFTMTGNSAALGPFPVILKQSHDTLSLIIHVPIQCQVSRSNADHMSHGELHIAVQIASCDTIVISSEVGFFPGSHRALRQLYVLLFFSDLAQPAVG